MGNKVGLVIQHIDRHCGVVGPAELTHSLATCNDWTFNAKLSRDETLFEIPSMHVRLTACFLVSNQYLSFPSIPRRNLTGFQTPTQRTIVATRTGDVKRCHNRTTFSGCGRLAYQLRTRVAERRTIDRIFDNNLYLSRRKSDLKTFAVSNMLCNLVTSLRFYNDTL